MGARKEQKLNFQTVSLNAILADHEIQSRVEVDMEWVNTLGNIVASGIKLPPVDVFRDPAIAKNKRIYLLANGFHRVTLARKNGDQAIDAVIHEGDRRDAILFSIGANVGNGKALTAADRKKAACILLRDPQWSEWSNNELAKKAGVAPSSISKWRLELGLPVPREIVNAKGVRRHNKLKDGTPNYLIRKNRGKTYGYSIFKGKQKQFGIDSSETRKNYEQWVKDKEYDVPRIALDNADNVQSYLSRRGFLFLGAWLREIDSEWTGGLTSLRGQGCLITWTESHKFSDIVRCVGATVIANRIGEREPRSVILCYPTPRQAALIDKLRDIDGGIEFMTPEEFVADLKAREGQS